ncbi:TPA: hypothetical protein ACF9KI_002791, partial [Staphylococcus aureus]
MSYGGLLKQKHKILNLDDAEDGNLEFRKTKLLFKKCETLAQKLAFFYAFCLCRKYSVQPSWLTSFYANF